MAEWNYIIISATLLLTCFMVWKEVTRANRLRLTWRIIASLAAAVSLACISLPVTFMVAKKINSSKEAILLSGGFNKDSINYFLRNSSAQYSVYATDEVVFQTAQSYRPTFISAIEMLNQHDEKPEVVHVFGYGLKPDELQQLNIPIVFHRSENPAGIIAINWQRKLASGDKLLVQGRFNNNFSGEVKLVLSGLHTSLDSLVIPPNTVSYFELATVPKLLDRGVYSISAIHKKDTIETEDIPVEVVQRRKMQVCVLAASPDFENKFLTGWLSQNGYGIAIRSRISKDKFQKEYVSTSGISLNNISSSVLDQFDVLIADAAELSSISKSELGNIQSAVQNKGLGLIVRTDSSAGSNAFYTKDFSVIKGKENNDKSIWLSLKSANNVGFKLPVEYPVYIRPDAGTKSLINDDKAAVFAAAAMYGNGKVVLVTVENTYSSLLSGNQESYHAFWSLLLDKAAKKIPANEVVTVSPALPAVNEPFVLSVQNNNPIQPGQIGEEKVYLQQDKLLPFIHSGTYWPAETGWLPEVNAEGKIQWLYVYKNNDWSAINASKNLRATEIYASKNSPVKNENKVIKKDVPYSVPKVYFFIIFITSAGFLWFEKKRNPNP